MKVKGIIETDLGIFLAHIHVGQRDGKDFGQISLPMLGDMNGELDKIEITDSSLDILIDVNGFPMKIFLEDSENGWVGKTVLETISFEKELTGTWISQEPDFREKYYKIPDANIENLWLYNSYENKPCDAMLTYELENQEVLAYLKKKGIDASNHRDINTVKLLMGQLCQQIHQDGTNYCHDRKNRGTIAQMEFAYHQNSKTNCRGIAIILCGILRAYGFRTNYVECWPVPEDNSYLHVVCEVFCEDLGKTVMVDPSSNLMYYLEGKPLSLMELKQAFCDGKGEEITINEDAHRGGEQIPVMQMLAYMSKNLVTLCKCVHSCEDKEMSGENCLCLLPVGLTDARMDEGSILTNNVQQFYAG